MAAKRPQSESQFLDINGVGPQKLKEYGKTFLSLIMSEWQQGEWDAFKRLDKFYFI